ncbi:MAG: NAD(P)H-quinone oxidoreductase [Ferruginibacter sp.]
MKVISIEQPGGPEVLKIKQHPMPVPAEGQVLIRVKAAGVNRPDIAQRKGNYAAPPGVAADIPGLEVSGVIEATNDINGRWKTGDAVCALLAGGGYATYAVVDARHCLPIPDGFSFEEACTLPETVFTVWHNVFQRGALKANEHFLVHGGSSGIGVTAIQLAKAFGAMVFATAGSDEKCAACMHLGASLCVNYKEADFEKMLMPYRPDVILDMIGGDYTAKNIRLLNDDGRLIFINAMKSNKVEMDIMDLMKRRLTISGSTLRSRNANFKAALAAEIEKLVWPIINNGQFKPVIDRVYALEEASLAHERMESSGHIGKIVLKVE